MRKFEECRFPGILSADLERFIYVTVQERKRADLQSDCVSICIFANLLNTTLPLYFTHIYIISIQHIFCSLVFNKLCSIIHKTK